MLSIDVRTVDHQPCLQLQLDNFLHRCRRDMKLADRISEAEG